MNNELAEAILGYAANVLGMVGTVSNIDGTAMVYWDEGTSQEESATFYFDDARKKQAQHLVGWVSWNNMLPVPRNCVDMRKLPEFCYKHGHHWHGLFRNCGMSADMRCEIIKECQDKLRAKVRKEVLEQAINKRAKRALKRRAEMSRGQIQRVLFYKKLGGLDENIRKKIGEYI